MWEDAKLPDDKILMPGVICHATNVVEHPDYVAELILKYAGIVGRERVIAATDCGFRWRVHPEIAWAKLSALVEGARLRRDDFGRTNSKMALHVLAYDLTRVMSIMGVRPLLAAIRA